MVGTVGQRDFATAPDGGEEVLIEVQLAMSFDEYCEQHSVKPGEYGAAFAAYLHELSGSEWDGDAERVDLPGAASATRSELQVEPAHDDEREQRE